MVERPIHDSRQSVAMGSEKSPFIQDELLNKEEVNQNFLNSIQDLQLFFELYNGIHSKQ